MKVTVTRTDVPGIKAACNQIKWTQGYNTLGCSKITGTTCDVYIATDDILFSSFQTYDAVWRHERGHCKAGDTIRHTNEPVTLA